LGSAFPARCQIIACATRQLVCAAIFQTHMKLLSRIVFMLLIGELILGGGGRLIAFGPVSLRMILFTVAIVLSLIFFIRGRRMPSQLTFFLVGFMTVLAVGLIIGIISGATARLWIEDVKPLLYVLILPFFHFVMDDTELRKAIPGMIITGALILAIAFFSVLMLIHSGGIPFLTFYHLVIDTGEFFFRAETTFFYKGFIYLCIALIFLYFTSGRYRTVLMTVIAFAILLTFTRGFIFALALTYIFYTVIERKYLRSIATATFLLSFVFFAKPVIYNLSAALHSIKRLDEKVVPKDQLLGNREESDAGRIEQVRQVFSGLTVSSFIVGHGFGNGVPARPVHMEISYLEIFHKQGLLGLTLWSYLFYLLLIRFKRSSKDSQSKAFFYSSAFIFLQSTTNQFINNPIGLSFVLLSLIWLEYASIEDKSSESDPTLCVTKKVLKFQL
jgi:hypothetical protein